MSDGVVEASRRQASQRSVEHRLDEILRAAEDEARDIRETVDETQADISRLLRNQRVSRTGLNAANLFTTTDTS